MINEIVYIPFPVLSLQSPIFFYTYSISQWAPAIFQMLSSHIKWPPYRTARLPTMVTYPILHLGKLRLRKVNDLEAELTSISDNMALGHFAQLLF